jgi:methylase of polypeptide subunit release factors
LLNSPNIKNCFVIDKSKKALEVNKINIEKYWLQDKIVQLKWGLLKPIFQLIKTQKWQKIYKSRNLNNNSFLSWFSWLCWEIVITANLPYIKNWDYKNVSSETLKYEPKMALFWGKETGFELYEKLIKEVMKLNIYKSRNLINGNYLDFKVKTLFIEIWFDQYKYSRRYLENLWLKYEYFKDNSWIWRCVKIYF